MCVNIYWYIYNTQLCVCICAVYLHVFNECFKVDTVVDLKDRL